MVEKNSYKMFTTGLVGFFVLILGITLTLMWWEDVVDLFRGFIGLLLAGGGLLILYSLNKK
ncbi:hypothetical protein MNBD_UNCLBAC01-1342 [hydrothermal vent metagenome]|uniref:Uncharacterized protein n=1 Tax=hydrothermal vent metagenome TaxID=652676 RepID=A0A3B1D5B4_9ZZZZ